MRRSAAVLTALLAVAAPAYGQVCNTYDGRIYWHGPTFRLYVYTPVWGCIADYRGECSPGGGYLLLENFGPQVTYWTSLQAGEGVFRRLNPGERVLKYLAIYRRAGDPPIDVDMQIRVCESGPGNTNPGGTPGVGGTPGGGGGTPGTGGGGSTGGGASETPQTYFVERTQTFSEAGEYMYDWFHITQNTTLDVRFVSDYVAQAALIPERELANFQAGRGFSGYAIFDKQSGTQSVTLPPGTYYAAARNLNRGPNAVRLEVDHRLRLSSAAFNGWDIGGTAALEPGHYRYHSFTIVPGLRYFLDGANSGVQTFILPNNEIDNFTSGRVFRYYVDYRSDDTTAPGLWEITLPPGTYWLTFRNQDSVTHSVTYRMERWQPLSGTRGTHDRVAAAGPTAFSGGLQHAWINEATRSVVLRFAEPLDPATLTASAFRIAAGDVHVSPASVGYVTDRGFVMLRLPHAVASADAVTVSWTDLRTLTGATLAGETDPLHRASRDASGAETAVVSEANGPGVTR